MRFHFRWTLATPSAWPSQQNTCLHPSHVVCMWSSSYSSSSRMLKSQASHVTWSPFISPTSSAHSRATSTCGFAGIAAAGALPSFTHSPRSVGAQLFGAARQLENPAGAAAAHRASSPCGQSPQPRADTQSEGRRTASSSRTGSTTTTTS